MLSITSIKPISSATKPMLPHDSTGNGNFFKTCQNVPFSAILRSIAHRLTHSFYGKRCPFPLEIGIFVPRKYRKLLPLCHSDNPLTKSTRLGRPTGLTCPTRPTDIKNPQSPPRLPRRACAAMAAAVLARRELQSAIRTKTPQKAAKHHISSSTIPRDGPPNMTKTGRRSTKTDGFLSFLVKKRTVCIHPARDNNPVLVIR